MPPHGFALSLKDAAERLVPVQTRPLPSLTRVIVVCSDQDPRHPAQIELARLLGASVHWVGGGHLFPMEQPRRTAEIIVEEFG